VCREHTFSAAPPRDRRFYSAWNSLSLHADGWLHVHEKQERGLRRERSNFAQ
jgi:hypothetical protein